jgi:hypothetical protein
MSNKPMRLPPLRVLRVRNPNRTEPNPCVTVMSSVLGMPPPPTKLRISRLLTSHDQTACWASAGYHGRGCTTVEQALRACMDAPAAPTKSTSTINYHLSRFSNRLIAQGKKK